MDKLIEALNKMPRIPTWLLFVLGATNLIECIVKGFDIFSVLVIIFVFTVAIWSVADTLNGKHDKNA